MEGVEDIKDLRVKFLFGTKIFDKFKAVFDSCCGGISRSMGSESLFLTQKGTFKTTKPYKSYVVSLTQTSTGAPSPTVLINELGGVPVWSRNTQGYYDVTLAGAFTVGKTLVLVEPLAGQNATGYSIIETKTLDYIRIGTIEDGTGGLDEMLLNTVVEIKVFE